MEKNFIIALTCAVGAVVLVLLAVGWRYLLPPRDESAAPRAPSVPVPRQSVVADRAFAAVVEVAERLRSARRGVVRKAPAALPRPSESPPITRNPAFSLSAAGEP